MSKTNYGVSKVNRFRVLHIVLIFFYYKTREMVSLLCSKGVSTMPHNAYIKKDYILPQRIFYRGVSDDSLYSGLTITE